MKEATETKVKTKYRELLGLFRSLRKEQAILLMICFISIISNLYFTYLVQDVVDLFVVNHDVTKMKQCLGSMLFWGIYDFISKHVPSFGLNNSYYKSKNSPEQHGTQALFHLCHIMIHNK